MKPLSEQELREKIQDIFNDCTSGWLITIKDFNGEDRSLESLENEIIDDILTLTIQDRKAWGEQRKQAYSLGFDTAKKIYMHKMVRREELLRVYSNIATAYRQTTGIEDDLFTDFLDDKSERQRNQGEEQN